MRIPVIAVLAAFCATLSLRPALAASAPTISVTDALAAFDHKDYSKASDLFKQAASSGDATAELVLGYLYEHGHGVARDRTQARQWYTLALTKTDQIEHAAVSAGDQAFLHSAIDKAKSFVAAREQEDIQAEVPNVYTGDQYRDPFSPLDEGKSQRSRPFTPADFSIHHLVLTGIMDDGHAAYALFTDPDFGVSFILRQGRLYDEKGKIMPGIQGTVNPHAKAAELVTSDQDVQPFRLGTQ